MCSVLFMMAAPAAFAEGADVLPHAVSVASSDLSASSAGVVFRSTQKLRSNDGREIYLYPSGKCELYIGDRLEVSCMYTVVGNEIRLLDGDRVVYKGTFRYASDGRTVLNLSLAGTIYYRK